MERLTVRRTVDLDCTPAELWRIVTDPDELSAWLGRDVALELRPGGRGSLLDGDTRRQLAVREVVEGERLGFTWWPDDDEGASSDVTFVVEPTGDRSRLVITETAADAGGTSWDARLITLWLSICSLARV